VCVNKLCRHIPEFEFQHFVVRHFGLRPKTAVPKFNGFCARRRPQNCPRKFRLQNVPKDVLSSGNFPPSKAHACEFQIMYFFYGYQWYRSRRLLLQTGNNSTMLTRPHYHHFSTLSLEHLNLPQLPTQSYTP
jgi:hypothetical protein